MSGSRGTAEIRHCRPASGELEFGKPRRPARPAIRRGRCDVVVGDVEVTFQLVLAVIAAIGVVIEVLTLLGPIAGDP